MNRLTYQEEDGTWGIYGFSMNNVPQGLYDVVWKLKNYEDSGLSPQEVKDMIRSYPRNEMQYDMESVIEQLEEKILKTKEKLMDCFDENYAVRLRVKMSAYEEIKEIIQSAMKARKDADEKRQQNGV